MTPSKRVLKQADTGLLLADYPDNQLSAIIYQKPFPLSSYHNPPALLSPQ